MWKVLSIRRSYYETEQLLVWVQSLEALLDLMALLNIDACTYHKLEN